MAKQCLKRTKIEGENGIVGYSEEQHLTFSDSIIPCPEDLEALQRIDSGFAQFFMNAMNEEQKVRHKILSDRSEQIKIDSKKSSRNELIGMIFALISVLSFVGLTAYSLFLGSNIMAGIFGVLSLSSIVSVFVNGKKR